MSIKLYNNDVEMDYDPIKHVYVVNGIAVPSVTTVTSIVNKPALIQWAVNESIKHIRNTIETDTPYTREQLDVILADAKEARFRKSQLALNVGSEAHDWIERYIKSRILNIKQPEFPEYPPVLNSVQKFLEWESEAGNIQYLSSERRIYSKAYKYSGTLDILFKINDNVIVADIKTSKAIYDEYFVQCAAYANAIQEEDKVAIDKVMVIRIPKGATSKYQAVERTDIDRLFGIFRACLAIWRWKNGWSINDN